MITRAEAELLVTDDRKRAWSYVLEGQTLRYLLDRLRTGRTEEATDILSSILGDD